MRCMKWVMLCWALALPASAEKPRIAVLPFTGKAAPMHAHLSAALCKQAKCVPPDSVLNAQHGPDWAKIAINGVAGVVSGRLVKAHHKQELELSVLVSQQQPAWTTNVPAEKLGAHVPPKLVKDILAHLAGGEPGEMPAPAALHEEAPAPEPVHETPVASEPPPPAAAPEPVPSETPEERAARAAAADQAFSAGGRGKKNEAPKVAAAAKTDEPPAGKPKPAPKAPEPEPAPSPSTSHGNYKPLPPELLSFTPRI